MCGGGEGGRMQVGGRNWLADESARAAGGQRVLACRWVDGGG